MAIERDNAAERLARIDKLMSETKRTPAVQTIRLQPPQQGATVRTQYLRITATNRSVKAS
jgi:hypothetical protein